MEYDGAVPGDNRYQIKTDAGVDAAVDAIAGELGSPKETAAAGDSTILVYEEDGQVDSVAVRPVEGGSVVSLYRDSFSDDTARDVRQAASTAVQSGV
ncbi:MAG: hypothetical protein SVW77_01105 [Candidatus Nanohaloarchaea archaeon]|nr:hypothetical protein [Candidatus Nanohaloarchaea archaeon]